MLHRTRSAAWCFCITAGPQILDRRFLLDTCGDEAYDAIDALDSNWTVERSTPGEALALTQAMQTFLRRGNKQLLDRRGKAGEVPPIFSEVAIAPDP